MTRWPLVLVLTLSTVVTVAHTAAPLAVRITPAVAFAPTTIRVYTTLQSNDENRSLQVSIDSADYYRSSQIQLEGSRAPHVVNIEFREVPDGDYKVTVRLIREVGDPAVVSGNVHLVPAVSR